MEKRGETYLLFNMTYLANTVYLVQQYSTVQQTNLDLWFVPQHRDERNIILSVPDLHFVTERKGYGNASWVIPKTQQIYRTPTSLQSNTPTGRSSWKALWKGQGLWINFDRATGKWTQMVHNLLSPLNYAAWLQIISQAIKTGKNIHTDLKWTQNISLSLFLILLPSLLPHT